MIRSKHQGPSSKEDQIVKKLFEKLVVLSGPNFDAQVPSKSSEPVHLDVRQEAGQYRSLSSQERVRVRWGSDCSKFD